MSTFYEEARNRGMADDDVLGYDACGHRDAFLNDASDDAHGDDGHEHYLVDPDAMFRSRPDRPDWTIVREGRRTQMGARHSWGGRHVVLEGDTVVLLLQGCRRRGPLTLRLDMVSPSRRRQTTVDLIDTKDVSTGAFVDGHGGLLVSPTGTGTHIGMGTPTGSGPYASPLPSNELLESAVTPRRFLLASSTTTRATRSFRMPLAVHASAMAPLLSHLGSAPTVRTGRLVELPPVVQAQHRTCSPRCAACSSVLRGSSSP